MIEMLCKVPLRVSKLVLCTDRQTDSQIDIQMCWEVVYSYFRIGSITLNVHISYFAVIPGYVHVHTSIHSWWYLSSWIFVEIFAIG